MSTNEVLIIVGLAIVAVLIIVLWVAIRRRKSRAFAALTPEERELTYAKRGHAKTVSALKGELKAQEKSSKKRSKAAENQLKDATKIGSDVLDSRKGRDGTVSLTGLVLSTPSGDHDITGQTTASVEAIGTAPAAEGEPDTRRIALHLAGAGFDETHEFDAEAETEVRALAAKIASAAAHVDTLRKQRDDAVKAAEDEVAEATTNATVEANNAQARYDTASQESLAKMRAAEDAVRLRGINPK
jgi:hypothetical protein